MRGRSSSSPSLLKAFFLLLLGSLLGGGAVYFALHRSEAPRAPGKAADAPETGRTRQPGTRGAEAPGDFEPAGDQGHGVIALVLDDLGYRDGALDRVARLSGPIALAVLPDAPRAGEAAALARKKGWDLLVHLPMSSVTGKAEPGEISPVNDDRTIEEAVSRAIDRLPGAVGLNNHQGSAAMDDRRVVRTLLRSVRDRHLFFLDSRTGPSHVAEEEARALGAPMLARDVFLDAEGERGLSAAWQEAVRGAARKGEAIVLAHPHASTLDFLEKELPQLGARGLRLVKVSELVD